MKCSHDSRGVCWLCSDEVSWWREARVRAGLGIRPPNPRVQPVEMSKVVCNEAFCLRPVLARGYCTKHYMRLYKAGKFGHKINERREQITDELIQTLPQSQRIIRPINTERRSDAATSSGMAVEGVGSHA